MIVFRDFASISYNLFHQSCCGNSAKRCGVYLHYCADFRGGFFRFAVYRNAQLCGFW